MNIPELILLSSNRVWRTYSGGRTLDIREGKENPEDTHFPEDWIASTTQAINKDREDIIEGFSKVTVDSEELLLEDLMKRFPTEMLGETHYKKYGANTQFLLKFLDSAIRLHIQAHPTIAFAKKHLNSDSGKTEAYIILAIREEISDPYIYLGFQNPVPKAEYRQAVLDQDINKILSGFEKIPIHPGDVFIVPGGLPHAIGEGVLMIEIMEPSDLAVRLEFERGGYVLPEASRFMNGGVDLAMDIIDFTPISVEDVKTNNFCHPRLIDKQAGGEEFILVNEEQTPCFSVHRIEIKDSFEKLSDSFYVAIVTKGFGSVSINHSKWEIKEGDRFFVPFQTESAIFASQDSMELMLTFPPK